MTLSLTPAEAEAKIAQVDDAMVSVRALASKILDTTQTMTAGSWQGGRAHTFNAIMTQHHEDFNAVINALSQVAEKGKTDIRTLVSHDSN